MPAGPTVILTREAADNHALRRELAAWDIPAVSYPCLATEYLPVDEWRIIPPAAPAEFRVVLVTSRRGARALQEAGDTLLHAPGRVVAAVGASTADALREALGREPDLVAADARSLGLAQELAGLLTPGEAVLHVRGSKSTGELKTILGRSGFAVHEMIVYRNLAPDLAPLTAPAPWVVVVASPSAVQRFAAVNGPRLDGSRFVAIGPTTAQAVTELVAAPVVQARSPRREHLVSAVRQAWEDVRTPAANDD